MKNRYAQKFSYLMIFFLFLLPVFPIQAKDLSLLELPSPQTKGGKPLMEALSERRSERQFSSKDLPLQLLSDLLWAANGINRADSQHKTAPTAMNLQEIDIYVVTKEGVYFFESSAHKLTPVLSEDILALTGEQPFVKDAPVNLIFVADLAKMDRLSEQDKDFYAATDTGFISQNIYLFCASEGLATVVRGLINKPALAKAMRLRADQKIILAQTIGYPKQQ